MKKHFIGGTLADFTWDLSKISMSDSHVSYANFDVWVIILNVWKGLIKILEGTFWQTINEKMSECLRTCGPQIIRVPQLQIEDWAWLVVPSYKLQN